MKRKYIAAVFLLLSIGVISTFALSYTQTGLEEPWDTIYTLTYIESELQLSDGTGLKTELVGDDDIRITIPASSTQAVTPKFTIIPKDGDGDTIWTEDAGQYSITVTLYEADGTTEISSPVTESITVVQGTEQQITNEIEFLTSSADIGFVKIRFTNEASSGYGKQGGTYGTSFQELYMQLEVYVQDIS